MAGRSPKLVLLVLGTVVSLLPGAGLFALTSDSVTSAGNSAESGTWTPPAHHLQVAASDDFGFSRANALRRACRPGQAAGAGPYIGRIVCMKNAGTALARLTASVTKLVQTETECPTAEDEAGDVTWGSGAGKVGTGPRRGLLPVRRGRLPPRMHRIRLLRVALRVGLRRQRPAPVASRPAPPAASTTTCRRRSCR